MAKKPAMKQAEKLEALSADRRQKLPSNENLKIWRVYIETFEALRTELYTRLQNRSGLSQPDYSVLLALSEASENRIRSSELAALINWDRSRLSHHLRRMEKRGLVQRQECKIDGRGAEVMITREGAQTFRNAAYPHLRDVQELFIGALSPEQLQHAADVARTLRDNLNRAKD